MTREQQKARINRIRHAIIAGSAATSVAVAGYLGFTVQDASAGTGTTTADTTTTDSSSTQTSDSTSYADQYGDNSTQVGSGSGSSHAVTSGS